jgi:signal transduction histidine kinase
MNDTVIPRLVRIAGCLVIILGVAGLVLSPILGEAVSPRLWVIEPMAYVGAVVMIVGLLLVSLSYYLTGRFAHVPEPASIERRTAQHWGELTLQYFELFNHDLGRPLRRILGKERELRALLRATESDLYPEVKGLLDEIEGQAPNFRLMMSNVQVLVRMEAPESAVEVQPVEPSEVIRKIIDRYSLVSSEAHKQITWWSEPSEFGLVYSESSAIEHIVTNLVDNAVRFARQRIEIRLSKNPTHFFIRVWDDGPGVASHYMRHIFDRGWTPEVAKREERTSSGLGLFIARTLAKHNGGDLTVESIQEPDPNHFTEFLLTLPLKDPEGEGSR